MKKACKVVLLCAMTLVPASAARADFIDLSGGVAGTIPLGGANVNDFIPSVFPGPQIGGYYGANILFDAPLASRLVLDFFGAEAAFVNSLEFLGSPVFTHAGGGTVIVSTAFLHSTRFRPRSSARSPAVHVQGEWRPWIGRQRGERGRFGWTRHGPELLRHM